MASRQVNKATETGKKVIHDAAHLSYVRRKLVNVRRKLVNVCRELVNVRRENLDMTGESFVPFRQARQSFIDGH
jgi:hypothetical protein